MKKISGFSKLSKLEKINFIVDEFFNASEKVKDQLKSFWHSDSDKQKVFDEFSENTLTNFFFPYGVVPNMQINDETFVVPMVIEESSVVAAASKAAKFWSTRGGFKTHVLDNKKVGQVHFIFEGSSSEIQNIFNQHKEEIINSTSSITENMEKRGGGLLSLDLLDKTNDLDNYYQLYATFDTCDAMGANFINSVLEALGKKLESIVSETHSIQIIMCILSNYTPECIVRAEVSCRVENLYEKSLEMSAEEFASKFERAVKIATIDVHRATTHNKGIFNGVDAVVLATGNDFRATEACGHTYAARDGQYRSLSKCEVKDGVFKFWMDLPIALGTVGGLTKLHPMAKLSLDLLGGPSADKLMEIAAAVGLAQNFAALRSLVTSGIQKGHMKMHLLNIFNQLEANEKEREILTNIFEKRVVSYRDVREELSKMRNTH